MKKKSLLIQVFTKTKFNKPIVLLLLCLLAAYVSMASTLAVTDRNKDAKLSLASQPFTCNDGIAYQTVNSTEDNTSALYGYNVSTGVRDVVATLPFPVNGLVYSSVDNLLWAARTGSNQIVSIDQSGATTSYPIANLPAGSDTGAELPGGYMLLCNGRNPVYYVVDINPARQTYLQLVDPTAGFIAKTGPDYGTTISSPLNVSDVAFVSKTQLCYGITPQGYISSLNPFTGVVSVSESPVNGLPTGSSYGAVFSDVYGRLYVFNNGSGSFFLVNTSTNSASQISTSIPSNSNDGASCAGTSLVDLPFNCEDQLTYQVAASNGATNSSLYSYNIGNGNRTLIAELPYSINGLIYNSLDNMLWGSDNTSLVRIDREGGTRVYPIPNLPVANPGAARPHYNTGAELPGGYMLLLRYINETTPTYYYVIDMDPSRTTYLQLVDPTSGFTLKTGPVYGTLANSSLPLNVADMAYVNSKQLCYSITPDGLLVSLDPLTGNVVFGTDPVSGLPTGGFGAIVSDVTGRLYAFNNSSGSYYRIDIGSNSATLISTTIPSGNNDGASCSNTILENLPFSCNDGITYQVSAAGTETASSLYAMDVSAGTRTLIAPLPFVVNGLIYNSSDDMLWASVNSNNIARIDHQGGTVVHSVPNLPGGFNVGVELPNAYMMLMSSNNANYYVVDINPNRSTYLQLVDPTANFILKTGPNYGTALSSPINISDIAFVSASQLCYGITNDVRLASLNPFTGAVSLSEMPVSGLPTGGYGAVVTDASGLLYAFHNPSGGFYRIDIANNSANLIATFTPSSRNDGANCSTVTLCDIGLTEPTDQIVCVGSTAIFSITTTGTGPFTYQWQVSADNGTSWSDLPGTGATNSNGSYSGAATSDLSLIPANTVWNGNLYRVNVGNGECTVRSRESNFEVLQVPVAPTVSQSTVNVQCPANTLDLSALITSSTPNGNTLAFYTSTTPSNASLVNDPTNVGAGVYYAFYSNGQCSSGTQITVVGCSLPVTLSSFTLTKEESKSGDIILLRWSTTEEINSELFEVERSRDAKSWRKIGTVLAEGKSNTARNYDFIDSSPLRGENYYRLKMVDADETFAYSRIRYTETEKASDAIYPNPATKHIFLKNYDQIRNLQIYSSMGVKMLQLQFVSSDGVNISNLTEGLYTVVITRTDGSVNSHKVIVVK